MAGKHTFALRRMFSNLPDQLRNLLPTAIATGGVEKIKIAASLVVVPVLYIPSGLNGAETRAKDVTDG